MRTSLVPKDLWKATTGFYTVWLAYLGRRYGILQELGKRAVTAKELSKTLHLHQPTVETWCVAAASAGILRRGPHGYRMPSGLVPYLLREESPGYLAGQLEYAAAMSLDYAHFDQLFRDMTPIAARDRARLTQAVADATRWDHTAFLHLALPQLPHLHRHFKHGAKVLDVGCGSGGWMVRTAARFPKSRFIGLDPDREALTSATQAIVRSGLKERVSVARGVVGRTGYTAEFDIAYLGEVLSAVQNPAAALAGVRAALKPAAHLLLLEGIVPATSSPNAALIHAMDLDQRLQGGRFFPRKELQGLLKSGGFRKPRWIPLGGDLWAIAADA